MRYFVLVDTLAWNLVRMDLFFVALVSAVRTATAITSKQEVVWLVTFVTLRHRQVGRTTIQLCIDGFLSLCNQSKVTMYFGTYHVVI